MTPDLLLDSIDAQISNESDSWWVYILLCEGGRYYCGISKDVDARFKVHLSGKGAFFTKLNRPSAVVAKHLTRTHREAVKLERHLKALPLSGRLLWIKEHPV